MGVTSEATRLGSGLAPLRGSGVQPGGPDRAQTQQPAGTCWAGPLLLPGRRCCAWGRILQCCRGLATGADRTPLRLPVSPFLQGPGLCFCHGRAQL